MVLGNHGRSAATVVFTPLAKVLHKLHVTPNMVTFTSSFIVIGLAVGLLARGYLATGAILLGLVLVMDSVDGVLARLTGSSSSWGAFLDSTMDRIADGAVFGALLWWAVWGLPDGPTRTTSIASGIVCMVMISVVPYTRARAENVGVIAKMGIAERTDRLVVALLCAALTVWGLPLWFYAVGLTWVAFASTVTVIQRMLHTSNELRAKELEGLE